MAKSVRSKVVALLESRLADCHYLRTQINWNIKGPEIIAFNKLFDQITKSKNM